MYLAACRKIVSKLSRSNLADFSSIDRVSHHIASLKKSDMKIEFKILIKIHAPDGQQCCPSLQQTASLKGQQPKLPSKSWQHVWDGAHLTAGSGQILDFTPLSWMIIGAKGVSISLMHLPCSTSHFKPCGQQCWPKSKKVIKASLRNRKSHHHYSKKRFQKDNIHSPHRTICNKSFYPHKLTYPDK